MTVDSQLETDYLVVGAGALGMAFVDIMRHRFLPSGRLRFFPVCEYLGDQRFRSRVTGRTTDTTRCAGSDRHDDGREESAVPADRYAPYSVRLPAHRLGRYQHGDAMGTHARAEGLGRTLRLNLMSGLDDNEDRAAVRELQTRFFTALPLAFEKLKVFAERVTPRERARIFG